jgi:DNA-binding response OmpR family regulator
MTHQNHTLLVTPNQEWPSTLYGHLWQNGFAPLTVASTGKSALDLFYQVSPRLVLVDLCISDCNAIDLCVEMLQVQPATKIALIAENDSDLPPLAYQVGISACVSRELPFAAWPGLLVYILSGGMAFSRRAVDNLLAEAWTAQERQPHLTIGPLRLDLNRRRVLYDGRRIDLTPREFALLACLARNTDRAVTFDQLLNEAWGYTADDGTPSQVRLYIARLRRKLVEDVQAEDFIVTERGIGYRLHSSALRQANVRTDTLTQHEQAVHQLDSTSLPHWRIIEDSLSDRLPLSL